MPLLAEDVKVKKQDVQLLKKLVADHPAGAGDVKKPVPIPQPTEPAVTPRGFTPGMTRFRYHISF